MSTAWTSKSRWLGVGVSVLLLIAAVATSRRWLPLVRNWTESTGSAPSPAQDDHAGHDHGHDHHDGDSLELSAQAQASLGLTQDSLRPIVLEDFRRTMTVPALIINCPGRTRLEVSTPMAGVITRVHAFEGEAVKPGAPLFDLRITAEELVDSQTELLKTVGELDVENREIARLTKISESGAISQRTLLERQYAKNKLDNLLLAQREALRLHGLSEHQIGEIVDKRRLFRDLRIVAPTPNALHHHIQLTDAEVQPTSLLASSEVDDDQTPLILTRMPVLVGQTVAAGATLAEVADYSELHIEGRTFERDANVLSRVIKNRWQISALLEGAEGQREMVPDLDLIYSATEIDVESRTLSFFVRLPNQIVNRVPSSDGHTFVEWRYRPGRRVQLLVPVEEWKNQVVLPVEAIARDGVESYVFRQNGNRFDRVPVAIKYRDAHFAVVANDRSLLPGDYIARVGAHQMQMALKNKSGGGVDPHAGHSH
jgi:cobalt-zinc-cadmium efflux system membrane fusion protein